MWLINVPLVEFWHGFGILLVDLKFKITHKEAGIALSYLVHITTPHIW
jgi:hypothetical protein